MDLLKDSPQKLFFKYLVPSVSATMVTSIYILADSIMIGKGIGELAIAALNIILPLFNIMFGTGALFGVGGAVLFSVAMGNGDPDRAKRRPMYPRVKELFPEYTVFIGGSSSFDMAPKPYNKYYALDLYCQENNLTHDQVVYIGDDYGLGGNDEAVYQSDFQFITIDNYLDFPKKIEFLLK